MNDIGLEGLDTGLKRFLSAPPSGQFNDLHLGRKMIDHTLALTGTMIGTHNQAHRVAKTLGIAGFGSGALGTCEALAKKNMKNTHAFVARLSDWCSALSDRQAKTPDRVNLVGLR